MQAMVLGIIPSSARSCLPFPDARLIQTNSFFILMPLAWIVFLLAIGTLALNFLAQSGGL